MKEQMLKAVQNAERFQTKSNEPLNSIRAREGLPTITREDVVTQRQQQVQDYFKDLNEGAKANGMTQFEYMFWLQNRKDRKRVPSARYVKDGTEGKRGSTVQFVAKK